MLTIHAVRTGDQVLLSQDEFTLLIQKVLEIQPVNVVEDVADDEMTEDDLRAYYEAKAEFETRRGKNFVFEPLMGNRKPPLDYRANTFHSQRPVSP